MVRRNPLTGQATFSHACSRGASKAAVSVGMYFQDRHTNRGYGVARAQQNVKCVRVMNACGQYLLGKKGPRVYTLVGTGHKNTVSSNTNIIHDGIVAACCTRCYSQT